MTYKEALDKIHSLDRFGSVPGLDRVEKLFSLIELDILDQNFIHIAGTNGKGSVATMLSFIFEKSEKKVGLFISPFITDFRERIQINNEMISEEELAQAVELIFPLVEKLNNEDIMITEFEFVTAIAFYIFKKNDCDIVISEVGLGGRLDSTNLIRNPLCSVITRIDFDHTSVLGKTLTEIATEKAGIIKENSLVVTMNQQKEVMDVIRDKALDNKCMIYYSSETKVSDISYSIDGTTFTYQDEEMLLPLLGKHQIENLKIALTVIEALKLKGIVVDLDTIKEGLKETKHPARFELISHKPLIILDGAHNPSGLKSFADSVKLYQSENPKTLILGMLKDKDVDKAILNIDSMFDKIITTNVNNSRSENSTVLAGKCNTLTKKVKIAENVKEAIDIAKMDNNDLYICGSLYLASEARDILLR